ncbi:MAG: TetR family transcriptional regulator [Ruminococcaceae bacterium]|nr:TetR family transcriptional regulator [Oscillospiraceae bacterium]
MDMSVKQKIAYNFEKLLTSKSFDDITVMNIVEASGISKATFYRYFKDKYDVLGYGIKNSIDSFFEPYLKGYSLKTVHFDFQEYLYSKKDFFYKAMKTEGPNSFENSLIEASIDLFYKIYEVKSVAITQELEDITELYCQGAVSYLRKWVIGGFKEAPEYVSKITYSGIPEAIKKYL